jgi:protein involved in polysaccharide export with SLBB domain
MFDTEIMMQRLSMMFAAIAFVLLSGLAAAHQQVDVVTVGGHVGKPGPYNHIENESLADLLNRIGGIPATQTDLERYRRGERVLQVRLKLYRDGKMRVLKIDPRSTELWNITIMKNDVVVVARAEPFEGGEYAATLTLKKEEVEQDGDDLPAAAADSKAQ